jgi:hypothetical protein
VSALAREDAYDPADSGPASPTRDRVATAVASLPAVDLRSLESGAALLHRIDRKYVVPVASLEHLVTQLTGRDDWAALEIDGLRLFGYESVYFDTPDLATYRAHLQRRRRRYKVRVRRYVDSGQCMLEVKRKGVRGLTVKERQSHDVFGRAELGEPGRRFVADAVGDGARLPVGELRPVVTTTNHRATIASLQGHARLTVDTDLVCGWGDRHVALRPGYVVLESKVQGHAATVDRLLRSMGERPVVISKYCLGVASLGLDVPHNPWRRTLRSYFDSCAGPSACLTH